MKRGNTAQMAYPEQMSWHVCKDTAQTWVAGGCAEPRSHGLRCKLGKCHLLNTLC